MPLGLLDLFRAKPKPCTACAQLSPGVHRVYSGLRHGDETDRLCTKCLLARLASEIRGKSILFTEPLTIDGYCFTPLESSERTPLGDERIRKSLASLGPRCANCSLPPRHLWMPLADLDGDEMESLHRREYCTIPADPARWTETKSLCDEHLISALRAFIDGTKEYFGTFRFPSSDSSGHYD